MRCRLAALVFSSFLFAHATAGLAQTQGCAMFDNPDWPSTLQLTPAAPVAGQAVTALVGPPTPDAVFVASDATIQIVGNEIVIDGLAAPSGFLPTDAQLVSVPLGNLRAGQYTVRTNFHGLPSGKDPAPTCNVVRATLTVAAAEPVSLPAMRWPALLLLGAALALGAGAMRRRVGSR